MRVLFVSSEISPLAKSGGLADVSAALPLALARLGVEMRLLMPAYPQAMAMAVQKSVRTEIADFMGTGKLRLISARMPDTGLAVWLMDSPSLFARGGGLYCNEQGTDWPDNARRFATFSHFAARLAAGDVLAEERADVVHANDWHTALAPLLLSVRKGPRPATVLTIHNLAYQGLFPSDLHDDLGLPRDAASVAGIEFYGKISFLKAGIRFADRITTVSPTYAGEILTPCCGCGLEGLLTERARDISGILNGVDYGIWDPASDPFIAAPFEAGDLSGKRACKSALRIRLGLDAERPLMAYICRLTDQKMTDVVLAALPQILSREVDLAVLGEGDPELERPLREAAARYPGRLAVHIGYEEPLAHSFFAGADILLHPSRFEPCGLAPLYALRYGSLPIVRHVGGLADTVVDASDAALHDGTANGFAFRDDNAGDMLAGIDRALAAYRQPVAWRRMQRTAMSRNFGWTTSAQRYLALYRALAPEAAAKAALAKIVPLQGAAD